MKKRILLQLFLAFLSFQVVAQYKPTAKIIKKDALFGKSKKIEFLKGKDIICPANFENANTYVAPKAQTSRNAKVKASSTFIVTYDSGFTEQAKAAFQKAVDIWSATIESSVPIRVNAYWQPLEKSTLGSARAGDFTRNFVGQQKYGVWYPIALAEKIAGKDLNSPTEPDIIARFNSDFDWSYNGIPKSGQYHLTSVVLHELCHGLGFTGSWDVIDGKGSWGYGTGSPFIYDTYLVNSSGLQLVDTLNYSNNSVSLKTQCISNNIFFDGFITNSVNTKKPKIFAPPSFQDGSSMSHLDDSTYPSGNENSLMTSRASAQEIILDAGPLVGNIFSDIGWTGTSILHEPIKSTEKTLSKIDVSVKIITDNILTANSYKVFYTENDTLLSNAKSIVLTNDGNSNVYSATIPITKSQSVIRYYFSVSDATKRTYTSPAEAPIKDYHIFGVGFKDNTPPDVYASPLEFVPSTSTPDVIVLAEDNFQEGIDTLYVEYSVNGVSKPAFGLKKYNKAVDGIAYSQGDMDDFLYLAKNPFGKLANGDRVKYRFVGIDKAAAKNKGVSPAYFDTPTNVTGKTPDYFEMVISDLIGTSALSSYSNDFNTTANANDFATIGFSVEQPSGFNNRALHTIHPYKNGGDVNMESNLMALLLKPIKISSVTDSATITFDEIALVEPGEDDAVFGDNTFYDYVVVEGSYDGGQSWIPFADGYDANSNSAWLKKFASSLVQSTVTYNGNSFKTQDSKAVGSSTLFTSKEIKILSENSVFESGDIVLIRFRLFADELTAGWGWAIDNLKIQVPAAPPVTAIEPTIKGDVEVYPNPTTDEVSLQIDVPKNTKMATLSFYNTQGRKFLEQDYEVQGDIFRKTINVQSLPDGMYFVKLKTSNSEVVRKFAVKH